MPSRNSKETILSCFNLLSQLFTAVMSLNSINKHKFVFVMVMVTFEVRSEYLNIIRDELRPQEIKLVRNVRRNSAGII
jgi:hypothetical protein